MAGLAETTPGGQSSSVSSPLRLIQLTPRPESVSSISSLSPRISTPLSETLTVAWPLEVLKLMPYATGRGSVSREEKSDASLAP